MEQVAFVVRDPEFNVVGVSTSYLSEHEHDGQRYFYMRMFIHAAHRVTNLMRIITRATRDYLDDHRALRGGASGILIVTENPKLMRPGARKQFVRDGWTYAGTDPRGLDVWRFVFTP